VGWHLDTNANPHESTYLRLDISKARSRLNWHPAVNLDKALKLTIDWFLERRSCADIRAFTVSQIQAYQQSTTLS
jgi:CDP-glucose 4,6-dehydratase